MSAAQGAYDRTLGQVSEAADKRVLRRNTSPDEFVNSMRDEMGLPSREHGIVQGERKINAGRQTKVANAYEAMPVEPTPEAARSYDVLAHENQQIFDRMTRPVDQGGEGLTVEFGPASENPYYKATGETGFTPAVGEAVTADMRDNHHLWVDQTGSFGESHPYWTPEQNNIFRAVHDFVGHNLGDAKFGSAGEDLTARYQSQLHSEEAQPALMSELRGQDKALRETGAFPEQKANLLPSKMNDPEYLAGASPWARKLVDQIRPEGITEKVLQKIHGVGKALTTKGRARELAVLVEAERNRLAHSPAATQSVEAARYLVDNFGIKAEDANPIIHDILKDRITGREPQFQAMVEQDPMLKPFLEEAGWVPELDKLPEGIRLNMTPDQAAEFDAMLGKAHASWEQQFAERIDVLSQSRPGMKGLEKAGSQEVELTKTQQRTQKEIAQVRAQADKLRERAATNERTAAEKQIAGHEAEMQRQAQAAQNGVQEGQGYSERAYNERAWEAKGFKGKKWTERTIPALMNRLIETGGFTYNPYHDHIIDPAWLPEGTTALPPGVHVTTGDGFAVSILPRVGETPSSTFQIPIEQWNDLGPGLLDRMKGFAPLFENPDVSIGGWIEDGEVHLDLSQTTIDGKAIDRSDAMLLASARNQLSVTDLGAKVENFPSPAGSVRISRQMLASDPANLRARQSVARTLYAGAAQTMELTMGDGSKVTVPVYPWIDAEHIDSHMGALDYQAWVAHRAHPEKYPDPASVYKDMEFRFARDASKLAPNPNRRYQTYLGATLNMDLWKNATAAVKDWDTKVAPWYFKSKDFIDRNFKGKEVTLLDGSKRPADEFFTDMLAVLSVSADPKANLKYALTGYNNLDDFLKSHDYNMKRVEKAVQEMMDTSPKKRTSTGIFEDLTRDTHLYPSPKKPLMELFKGTTLDDMTPDYFTEIPQELWGAGDKNVTKDMQAAADANGGMDTPEGQQAAMEEGGSRFYAKIKSFKDNLTDPANSTSVTLDSWMARLFGEQDWMAAGKYRVYADQIRALAEEISQREGREVKPHEVQAVMWAFAKQEIGRMDAGKFRHEVNGVLGQIEDGTWHPSTDTVLQGLEADQAALDRAIARRDHNAARIARRNEIVAEKMGGVKDWSKHVPAKTKAEIMAQVDAELGPKQGGAWLKETNPVTIHRSDRPGPETVDRTTAITRPLTSAGEKESEANYIERNTQTYMDVAEEAFAKFDAGDKEGAKATINAWANKKLAKMEASANEFGDFEDTLKGAPEGLQDAMDRHGLQQGWLEQRYNRDVRGSFLLNEDGQALTHFFATADATTLTHEGAHMLRTLISDEDLHAIEMNLGFKKGEGWTPGREEQFANMVTGWIAGADNIPEGMRPQMERLRSTLATGYDEFNRKFNAGRVQPEMDQIFRQWFSDATVPDITREVHMLGRAKNIHIDPQTGAPLLGLPEVRGGPMAVGTAPNLETVSSPEAYRMGARATRLKSQVERADLRVKEATQAYGRAQAARDELIRQIEEGDLPGQRQAAKLDKRAAGRQATLDRAVENAPSRQWPREYRPMGEAIDSLRNDAKDNPELAQILEDVGVNFPAVLDRAKELGFDPVHVRDFTDAQVKKLMYDTIRLGDVGKLGKEAQAGTRKVWTGALAREGKAARSIEALGAAIVEVHHELRTNQLVDYIEQGIAVPWKGGDDLPHNYVEWDPIRNKMTGMEGEATSRGTRYIVPKQVDTVLKRMNQDFNHGLFRGLSKVTNPWRGLILTLSPRWYVNNFVGNVLLATLEGVKLTDWRKAWESYKTKDAGGRYADVPAVQGHSFVSDVGERNMVPTKGVKEAFDTGEGVANKIGRARRQIGHNLRRANEVVDEFARASVYHKTLRTGGSMEEALQAAQTALIDYGNMSPFEQQVIRSVVPFYAWQKNILKIVARMPVDHPIAAGVMMQLGSIQNHINADRFGGELPLGYAGLVGVGSEFGKGGAINTRGFNPFADALSLTTPEGIAGSVNPFADIAIRKALGAPDGGFVEQRVLSSYGTAIPDVPVGTALGDIGAGIPGFQLGQAAAGGGDKGLGQQSLKFTGLNYLTADDVKKIIARTKAARAQVEANAPFPAKKKKHRAGASIQIGTGLPTSLSGKIL